MNEPHFDLPAKHTVLRSFAGHLEAPADDVYALLVSWLKPTDDESGRRIHMVADPDERFIVVEGDWWYRAEYRVRPEVEEMSEVESESESEGEQSAESDAVAGAVVEFEIINVAQTAHWVAGLKARSVVRNAPAEFGRLLTELSDGLGAEE